MENDFLELARLRHSVRAYRTTPVAQDQLNRILEAARVAPTAVNKQPFRLIVIRTAGREAELRRIYNKDWFAVQPPIVIAICTVGAETWTRKKDGRNYGDVDAAIVMDHLILAAEAEGLGTCWVAAFDPDAAREILNIPDGVEPVAFTPVGYGDPFKGWDPGKKKRKPLKDLVMYDRWEEQ